MSSLRVTARRVLDDAWRPNGGYASPNLATYPWQWLWDSCFHALIWARVGDGRAVTELESLFRWQTSQGFVPHMGYQEDPRAAVELWGQPGASTITQPPMWGHAARLVTESGFSLSSDLLERMWQGFEWLWRHRMRDDILVLVHPWESGCDDSARWRPTTRTEWDRPAWKRAKLALLQTLEVDDRAAVANPAWEVGSAGFNAVVAFNVRELLTVDARPAWATRVAALEAALFRRFDADLGTWTDDPPSDVAGVGLRCCGGYRLLRSQSLDGQLSPLLRRLGGRQGDKQKGEGQSLHSETSSRVLY